MKKRCCITVLYNYVVIYYVLFIIVDCDTLVLPEDNAFAGFVPLLEALQDPVYVFRPYDKVCHHVIHTISILK